MKRSGIDLQAVTEWANLCEAFYLAARGKRNRPEVRGFARNLDVNLAELGRDIRVHSYQPAPMTCFRIRDPKPRIIHAPCFRDRVAHHAIMYARDRLALAIKPKLLINRSALGVPFCGYRVLPSSLRLSRRKQRRYALHRERWEKEYLHGTINEIELQAGYSSALALTCHADAAGWRAEQLRRRPLHPLLEEV